MSAKAEKDMLSSNQPWIFSGVSVQLRTKSSAIIDHLEERNGLADIDDRSYHGLPEPSHTTTMHHFG